MITKNINILFLEEKKENIWEHDFIVNELFKNIKVTSFFIPSNLFLTQKIENTINYDCLVFLSFKENYENIKYISQKLKPKIIINLSDEHKNVNRNEFNSLALLCHVYLRNYDFLDYKYEQNTIVFPLGYTNNFYKQSINKMKNRQLVWSWHGRFHPEGIEQDRHYMLEAFLKFTPFKSNLGLEITDKQDMYADYYNSMFVPCGRGNQNLNCFRIYEAIMCGAIPCVVGEQDEIHETFSHLGKNLSWIFADSWDGIIEKISKLLPDVAKMQAIQDKMLYDWFTKLHNIRKDIVKFLMI